MGSISPPTAHSSSFSKPCDTGVYDVIIVGAGLAGLQAALDISRAGVHNILVLEARDRIGGKTLTTLRPDGLGHQELGVAWINDSNQSRMWELAQEFGLIDGLVVQNTTGDVVVHDFGGDLVRFPYGDVPEYAAQADTEDCLRVRDLVAGTASDEELFRPGGLGRKRLDGMSFETWLFEQGVGVKGRATAQVWTIAMLGVDPSEVSALYFLEYCKAGGGLMTMRSDGKNGGQYLRLKEGTSSFAKHMARQLTEGTIRLSAVVAEIDQSDNAAVLVTTSDRVTFKGRKVIVSIPTPVYKTFTWAPQLPPMKAVLANQTRYGCYTKYIVLFKMPFWREEGFCGLAQSFTGPVSVTRDTSVDDEGNFAITCFIGGTLGRKWSALSKDEKKAAVLRQLGDMFAQGRDIQDICLASMESPWIGEEWSGWGCPCPVMPPGILDEGFDEMCAPFGNIHFIGTETATIWRGYMEGAVRSGTRGASEVLEALGRTT